MDLLPNFPEVSFRGGGKDFLGIEGASDAAFQQGERGMPYLVESPPFSAMDSVFLHVKRILLKNVRRPKST